MLAAALADIFLDAIFSVAITPVIFAVAGVYAGFFSFGFIAGNIPKEEKKQISFYLFILLIVISLLIFFLLAPLSGREYSLASKCFAITQFLMAIFLRKEKLFN